MDSNTDLIKGRGKTTPIGQVDKAGRYIKTAEGWKPVKTHGHLFKKEEAATATSESSKEKLTMTQAMREYLDTHPVGSLKEHIKDYTSSIDGHQGYSDSEIDELVSEYEKTNSKKENNSDSGTKTSVDTTIDKIKDIVRNLKVEWNRSKPENITFKVEEEDGFQSARIRGGDDVHTFGNWLRSSHQHQRVGHSHSINRLTKYPYEAKHYSSSGHSAKELIAHFRQITNTLFEEESEMTKKGEEIKNIIKTEVSKKDLEKYKGIFVAVIKSRPVDNPHFLFSKDKESLEKYMRRYAGSKKVIDASSPTQIAGTTAPFSTLQVLKQIFG